MYIKVNNGREFILIYQRNIEVRSREMKDLYLCFSTLTRSERCTERERSPSEEAILLYYINTFFFPFLTSCFFLQLLSRVFFFFFREEIIRIFSHFLYGTNFMKYNINILLCLFLTWQKEICNFFTVISLVSCLLIIINDKNFLFVFPQNYTFNFIFFLEFIAQEKKLSSIYARNKEFAPLYHRPFMMNVAKRVRPFRKNIQFPAISMPALSRSGSILLHGVDDPVVCNEVIPSESSSCG